MTSSDKDTTVFSPIEALVAEEHKLFERGELDATQYKRLAEIQTELDRYWDLLRQRRALASSATIPQRRASAMRIR